MSFDDDIRQALGRFPSQIAKASSNHGMIESYMTEAGRTRSCRVIVTWAEVPHQLIALLTIDVIEPTLRVSVVGTFGPLNQEPEFTKGFSVRPKDTFEAIRRVRDSLTSYVERYRLKHARRAAWARLDDPRLVDGDGWV